MQELSNQQFDISLLTREASEADREAANWAKTDGDYRSAADGF